MRYIYAIVLVTGTAYLVGWCGWSKWTFTLTILLMIFGSEHKLENKK